MGYFLVRVSSRVICDDYCESCRPNKINPAISKTNSPDRNLMLTGVMRRFSYFNTNDKSNSQTAKACIAIDLSVVVKEGADIESRIQSATVN
jgi:hypothetical protein